MGIDSFIKNLVTRILDLVLTLSRSELQSKNATAVARGTFQMTGLETESEDESETSEISECENVNDMFDLSMKRLNFIENSLKRCQVQPWTFGPSLQTCKHSRTVKTKLKKRVATVSPICLKRFVKLLQLMATLMRN